MKTGKKSIWQTGFISFNILHPTYSCSVLILPRKSWPTIPKGRPFSDVRYMTKSTIYRIHVFCLPCIKMILNFFFQCHHMFVRTFVDFPPGCGDSVADFWGWDAHEARLRCPDDVSGDMQEDEIPGGALSLNLLTTQTMVTTGIFPCKEKFPW